MNKLAGWFILLLWPLRAGAIGVVYAGAGGDGREFLELTSVAVDVSMHDRVAVTRADQVFTNHSDRVLEGITEYVGAVVCEGEPRFLDQNGPLVGSQDAVKGGEGLSYSLENPRYQSRFLERKR